jgi:2-polyprenyl-3-methyl-5-hydroxy-6-metoxy-1,4-benzoquinol methylase
MTRTLPPLDARIPEWDTGDLIQRDCPVCASRGGSPVYIRPDTLTICRCGSCSTYYISPAPSERQLAGFYAAYDERHRRAREASPKQLAAAYARTDPFRDIRIRVLSSLMQITDARVLDVGFGRAQFLYYVKKAGGIPYGLDPDPKAIEFARYLGIDNVYRSDLQNFNTEFPFDLITLMDLIEHPLQPMDILRKSVQLLAEDGYLLIWTPNGESAGDEESPIAFRVDLEHMQYLTPASCQYIASGLRLQIVHLETLGYPSLDGIDKPLAAYRSGSHPAIKILKKVPGLAGLDAFRRRLLHPERDERRGAYHLFCIFRKYRLPSAT